ncbi:MAG: T9SS type A sorting domain-containing protein, partial [Bacteroidota bacterium]
MKPYFLFIFFLFCRICDAQNLVPNWNFEAYDTCPNSLNLLSNAMPWFPANGGTSDYFNSCFDSINGLPWSPSVDVPVNGIGVQNAKSGVGYAGLLTYEYNPNTREYLEVKLDSPLIQGLTYYVTFSVSRSDSCIWAVDNLGAYFSIDSALGIGWSPLPYTPQLSNSAGNFLTDRINWTMISGSFVAQGGEQFITIGNFNDDANTDTISVPGGNPTPQGFRYSYYYVDNVCVSSDSLTCSSSVGINVVNKIDEIILFPNPFSDKLNITANRNGIKEINFFDVTGRKIFNKSFTNSTLINTEQLAKGIYLYEVRNKNGVIKKGKVV